MLLVYPTLGDRDYEVRHDSYDTANHTLLLRCLRQFVSYWKVTLHQV